MACGIGWCNQLLFIDGVWYWLGNMTAACERMRVEGGDEPSAVLGRCSLPALHSLGMCPRGSALVGYVPTRLRVTLLL
eukprot:90349-Chlamydomonas_euryale.AAC.2